MPPLVSMVIPCYNQGRFLSEAVDSALAQTYRQTELVIVDDGSTDDTAAVARSYGSRLRYCRTPNRGVYSARNTALSMISGDYFVNLDADNLLHPQFVERALEVMRSCASPDLAFVYTQREVFGAASHISRLPSYDLDRLKIKNYIDLCSLIDARMAKRFGFDPAFNSGCGDYDFFLTLAEHGYRGILLDQPLFRYRVHDGSITGRLRVARGQVAVTKRIVRKHRRLYDRRTARRALAAARQSVIRSVLEDRPANAPLAHRFVGLLYLVRYRCALREVLWQAGYITAPRRYGIGPDVGEGSPVA